MKALKLVTLFALFSLVGCSALEQYDRSPAAKKAHKNFLNKKEAGNYYWRYDKADQDR